MCVNIGQREGTCLEDTTTICCKYDNLHTEDGAYGSEWLMEGDRQLLSLIRSWLQLKGITNVTLLNRHEYSCSLNPLIIENLRRLPIAKT